LGACCKLSAPQLSADPLGGITIYQMTISEKILYHQIHPMKLFTDVSTAFASTYLLWRHYLIYAILFSIVPSMVVSIVLIMNSDLEKYKESALGNYLKRYMDSRFVDSSRLFGFLLMTFGGWYQLIWLIIFGFLIIIIIWSRGLLFKENKMPPNQALKPTE
jgi:hypothetical protein